MANYYTLVTNVGKAKMANAQVTGDKVEFSKIALGSGGGNPKETQETLVDQKWKGNISNVSIDSDNPNWVVVEAVVPSSIGGFMINEVGLFDDEGDLIVIGKYPETYKPKGDEGTVKDIAIRIIIEVTNTDSVTMKVDPSVVIATRKYVEDAIDKSIGNIDFTEFATKLDVGDLEELATDNKENLVDAVNEIKEEVVSHKAERATTSKAGHVTLNDSTDSSSTTDAATANAVRKAYERAVEVDSRQVNYLEEVLPVDARSDSYPEGVSVMYINGLSDENSDWWNAIIDVIDVVDNPAGHRLLVKTERSGTTRGGYQEVYVISNFTVDNGAVRYKLYRGSSFTINRDWQDFKLDFDIEGTDMKGILKAYPNTSYTVPQVRNLILSDEEPEGVFGDHGDIWMVYE